MSFLRLGRQVGAWALARCLRPRGTQSSDFLLLSGFRLSTFGISRLWCFSASPALLMCLAAITLLGSFNRCWRGHVLTGHVWVGITWWEIYLCGVHEGLGVFCCSSAFAFVMDLRFVSAFLLFCFSTHIPGGGVLAGLCRFVSACSSAFGLPQ